MLSFDINWLAVIVATIAHQALGFLWYGPLFGRTWLAAMGKTREELQGPGPEMIVAVVASLVTTLALAVLLTAADDPGAPTGAAYGLVAGVGFAATTIVTGAVFEKRPPTLTWLYVGYQILGLAVVGIILGAWQ